MKDCGTCYYRNSTWSQQHREMSAQCDHQNAPEDALLVLRVGADSHVVAPDWCPLTVVKHPSLAEMLHSGLFRFVAGNVSFAPTGELIVTDGRFVHVHASRDFVKVADALGLVSTDDTGRIGAVASVEDVVAQARKATAALARQPDMFESLSMACENPPEGCDCAGCSYAKEKNGAHNE